MNIRYKHGIKSSIRVHGLAEKLCCMVLAVGFVMLISVNQPVLAQGKAAADLSLGIVPDTVTAGSTVQINSNINANKQIKVGMLLYRLISPASKVYYLEPIILRDFESGNSYNTSTDYQVADNEGSWVVEAYLCIGQCNVKGDEPPRNHSVQATAGFRVTGAEPQPLPGPGPLGFPR